MTKGNGHKPAKGAATATMMRGESVDEVTGEVNEIDDTGADLGVPADAHAEVVHEAAHEAAESGVEVVEASREELARADSGESAMNDLRGEGYEEAGEPKEDRGDGPLPDAGAAMTGGMGSGQGLAPLVTGLGAKVVPLLASPAGPSIARAVQDRLSPRTRRGLAQPRPGGGPAAMLQKVFDHAMTRDETDTGAVDDELIDEVVQTAETIIDADDRIRINATTRVPWRRYCALKIEFPNGAVYRGTGFFIGERVLATAGHCVYAHREGGWARRIEVIPGCDGTHRPFGSAVATTFRSTSGWTKNKTPAADYGAIVLAADAFPGQNFGSFGFGVFANGALLATEAVVAGYPGDKPFAELWGMARKIKKVTPTNLIYDIDTMGGQSGAPVYIMSNGKRYAVGIHNYGALTGNSATRVTAAVVANFKKWSALGTESTTAHSDLHR